MFQNKPFVPMILSMGFLILTATSAQAQRGRVAPGRGAAVYRGSYYRPGYAYPRYGYTYPRYAYPAYRYAYPTYIYPNYSYYYAPSTIYTPAPVYVQPATATTASADIRVLVPDPQATVLFDGRPTATAGMERLYHTPPLALGGTYTYRIRAIWMQAGRQVMQERVASVVPGQAVVVDFTRPIAETVPFPSSGN